jgi:hypothetical protein
MNKTEDYHSYWNILIADNSIEAKLVQFAAIG